MYKDNHITAEAACWGKLSLRIIWSAGIICIMVIWLFFNWQGFSAAGPARWLRIKNDREELGSIDELLVSSEEVKQTGQKSFVNVALRLEWNSYAPAMNEDNSRKQFYNDILKKKLQRLQKTVLTDFSIKPVPK